MRGSLLGSVIRGACFRPVRGAEITMTPLRGYAAAVAAHSNETGSFFFAELAPGMWDIVCRAPGLSQARRTVAVMANAQTSVEIDLERGEDEMDELSPHLGSIDGRVVDAATGRPLADATVVIVRAAGPAPDIAPLSDALGRFALTSLPPGDWTLAAFGTAGETGEASVLVRGGKLSTVVIRTG